MNTQMNPRIQETQEICWLDEKLLAYQEKLFSSEMGKNKKMLTLMVKRREKKAEDRDKRKIDEVNKEEKTCNFKNTCA